MKVVQFIRLIFIKAKTFLISSLISLLFLNACVPKERSKALPFSTDSDSTLYYYNLGWHQIMDLGDYSAAEVSYRKALGFDDDFLVGKSVLARLTSDLEERLNLYKELQQKKSTIQGDERLVLDVYLALTKYTNLRDQKSEETKVALEEAFKIGEQNLRTVISNFPNETYLKAEYFEVLHTVHGAEVALAAIDSLTDEAQKTNPFILGFKATLQAELEQYDAALKNAHQLNYHFRNEKVAKPDAILADIYFKMKSLAKAKMHADRAFEIDPKNLDASRLKTKIDAQLIQIKK